MCGLGAILRTDGRPIPEEWLDIIDRRIVHRGPDGTGRFRDVAAAENGTPDVHVALVHRRLAIIDPHDGAQPMTTGPTPPDLAVVFNGCIYNHSDLRRTLSVAGANFTTDHSDTEVLLHGYRAWGRAGLVERLEGMYAFALWDRAGRSLVLERDWFGEKPLYVAEVPTDGGAVTVAASDAKAVADVVRAVDPTALDTAPSLAWTQGYLQLGYPPPGTTPYDGRCPVRAVPIGVPASMLERAAKAMPMPGMRYRLESIDVTIGRLGRHLDRAVQNRLDADVPLGCFLSGGVDSSLIAHYAVHRDRGLRTFTVRMPDARYDESAHAERVASHLGTDHATLSVAPDPAADLVTLIDRLGQPFGDSSILPTHWVSRAAHEHVGVALSGDGGDELFWGYERYYRVDTVMTHRWWLRHLPWTIASGSHPKSRRHRLARAAAMARDVERLGPLAVEALVSMDLIADLTGAPVESPIALPAERRGAAVRLRRADLTSYLPGDLLTKVDTASMAVALEVRCPFLDHELVEDAVMQWRPPQRKGLLRALARKHLPRDIVDRPKMGFAVPVGEWLRPGGCLRPLLDDVLASAAPFGGAPVDASVVQRMVEEHDTRRVDHRDRLFALLTLGMWGQG